MKDTKKIYKATFLCDLDGTIFRHGTTSFLPGAKAFLENLKSCDYEVIFVTRRGDAEFKNHPVYSESATLAMLAKHGLSNHRILFDVMSPRFLVDDSLSGCYRVKSDEGYPENGPDIDEIFDVLDME